MLKKGLRSVIDVSSARDFLKIYQELKRAVEPILKPIEELRAEIVRPIAQPIEEEFKKTLSSILYSWVTDLGNAKELQNVDLEELYKKIKEHFK